MTPNNMRSVTELLDAAKADGYEAWVVTVKVDDHEPWFYVWSYDTIKGFRNNYIVCVWYVYEPKSTP